MKSIILLVLVAVGVGAYLVLGGSDRGPIGEPALSASPEASVVASGSASVFVNGTYSLVASSSSMTWSAKKTLIKDYVDKGTIAISSGTTVVVGGKVASGSVTVDMTSIKTLSTGKGSGESMQEKHIKGADFFDVEKYPTAKFSLSKLTAGAAGAYTVEGTLTLKGITKPVTFIANVRADGSKLIMEAKDVKLDRTEWDVRYGSGKFFQGLGDKVIDDFFYVSFTAVGTLKK